MNQEWDRRVGELQEHWTAYEEGSDPKALTRVSQHLAVLASTLVEAKHGEVLGRISGESGRMLREKLQERKTEYESLFADFVKECALRKDGAIYNAYDYKHSVDDAWKWAWRRRLERIAWVSAVVLLLVETLQAIEIIRGWIP